MKPFTVPIRTLMLVAILISITVAIMFAATVHVAQPNPSHHVVHASGNMLALTFAHADHVKQSCIGCHHNYVDQTGSGMCLDCHKTDPEIAPLIETQFHDLCRSCHLVEQGKEELHGPTRECQACHTPDNAP